MEAVVVVVITFRRDRSLTIRDSSRHSIETPLAVLFRAIEFLATYTASTSGGL